jgi:hypothetical protein
MRTRYGYFACMLGLSLLASGCYNNPDINSRHPGAGTKQTHSGPQVGPGTTAGGSTAGPQPVAHEEHKSDVKPTAGGATGDSSPGLGHAGAATPEHQPEVSTPAGAQSRTGNEKGVGERTSEPGAHAPAKH